MTQMITKRSRVVDQLYHVIDAIGSGEMGVLKEFGLSVNIESISFQRKVEHVDLWLATAKCYFKNENFEVYAEKKVSKELCTQFRAKSKFNSQIYIVYSTPKFI